MMLAYPAKNVWHPSTSFDRLRTGAQNGRSRLALRGLRAQLFSKNPVTSEMKKPRNTPFIHSRSLRDKPK
jgi:hypothetical protein